MGTTRSRIACAALAVAALAACGDDDETATDAPGATTAAPAPAITATTAAAPATTAAPGTTGSDTAVCDPYIGVTLAFNSPETDPASLAPMLDAIDAAAPQDIAAELTVMTTAARAAIGSDGPDFGQFETPEFMAAQGVVDPWMFDNCPFDATAEVSATEYAFTGLAAELPAGRLGLLLTNDGHEAHEIAVLRKNDGVTETWDELLALPEEEAMTKASQAGGAFAPTHGAHGLLVADLTPGEYLALCFVPTGTSMGDDGEFVEGDGPPHFVQGMRHEFTVTG